MSDTIAAIATAPGQGGIAIVRVSGDMAEDILRRIFRPVGGKHPLPTHLLTYGYIVEDAERIDECMAVIMRAPKSYTREDVVEFQLHGGGCVAQKVLSLCLSSGARLAQPGEFTRRAFLSGRIDLSQAEAIMDLIAAQGEQSRKAAMRQLTGGASSFIRKAADELYAIQAGVAACIDYPEEISEEEAASDLAPRIAHLAKTLADANDKYLRLAAEYDNYRKRTAREKEHLYNDAKIDTIKPFLAVLDNLERGVSQFEEGDAHRQGLELICKQFEEVLTKLNVAEIPALGEKFDPEKHNAVMHTEDETAAENTVVEVFQKGYTLGDKILRFAMVKVAN